MTTEQIRIRNAPELANLSERLITGFEFVYRAVGKELQSSRRPDPLAPTGVSRALQELQSLYTALRREPFLARVEVQWADTDESEILYVCRAGSGGLIVPELDGRLVSYRAELGKLAEIGAGEEITLFLPSKSREALVSGRVKVKPRFAADQWDGLDNLFDLPNYRTGVESLRGLIAFLKRTLCQETTVAEEVDLLGELLAQDEEAKLFYHERRRKTVLRMELRDQPILDPYQGEVFRLPLIRQLLLLGPPGTGKTTTLIKRLATKRMEEALTSEEREILELQGLGEEFRRDDSWVMFSPTDLLKLYVREAFAREDVPVRSQNLRTWSNERRHLGRNVLKFLRAGNRGKFTISEVDTFLISDRSDRLSNLFDRFSQHVDEAVIRRTAAALQWMEESADPEARRLAQQVRARLQSGFVKVESIQSLAEQSDLLQSSIASLRDRIQEDAQRIANALVAPDREARLRELETLLGSTSEDDEEDDEDEEEDGDSDPASERSALIRRLLKLTRSLGRERVLGTQPGKRSITTKLAPWIGSRIIDDERLKTLGEKVLLESRAKRLHGAARNFVTGVPSFYRQFRREQANNGDFFLAEVAQGRSRLTPPETDIVILAMLRNAQRAGRLLSNARWLDEITANQLMHVYVDEATDFSAVELACMLLRTHPKVRSWFACGDFRQRLTGSGIRAPDELDWIRRIADVPNLETRDVASNYRQSERLSTFARAIEHGAVEPVPQSPDDPPPLLVENLQGADLAAWLTLRIREIEEHVGRLPSIAIFVDAESRIDELVENARPLLSSHNIKIVGCREGRDVGQQQEIRVFDIKHIKGLEFEGVFFVGVDQLAKRIPELFLQYIYVGITRAASFLAICCDNNLPASIEVIRSQTSSGDWSRTVRES